MKYCKDCKHFRAWGDQWCAAKNSVDPNTRNALNSTCVNQRSSGWLAARLFGDCGREGRFFEPNEETS